MIYTKLKIVLIISFIICNALSAMAQTTGVKFFQEETLKRHVAMLAETIGERNYTKPRALLNAAEYIKKEFAACGYAPLEQTFKTTLHPAEFKNIVAVKEGGVLKDASVVLVAHYDTAVNSPGADDNASGVALLLELACSLKNTDLSETVKFVAVANEEPPFFKTFDMGSYRYAQAALKNRENITAAISIESVGYFSDNKGTQKYPPVVGWFYPSIGNYISAISDLSSISVKNSVARALREIPGLPVQDLAAMPGIVTSVSLSDQWSFWQFGYKALMVTDTAFYRTPHYHTPGDTPEKLDYKKMALTGNGLKIAVRNLAVAMN